MAEAPTPAPQELRLDDVATELAAWPSYWDHMRSTYPDLAHWQEAAALAARFAEVTGGTTVVHTDARRQRPADRRRPGPALRLELAPRGAAWLDTVFLLIGPRGDGLDGDAALARAPSPPRCRPSTSTSCWRWRWATSSAMPTSRCRPTRLWVREVQRWQGEVARDCSASAGAGESSVAERVP